MLPPKGAPVSWVKLSRPAQPHVICTGCSELMEAARALCTETEPCMVIFTGFSCVGAMLTWLAKSRPRGQTMRPSVACRQHKAEDQYEGA